VKIDASVLKQTDNGDLVTLRLHPTSIDVLWNDQKLGEVPPHYAQELRSINANKGLLLMIDYDANKASFKVAE